MKRYLLCAIALFLSFGFVSCGGSKLKQYRAEVVRTYPHDTLSYTQGLFFVDGRLFESTGLNGLSTLREVELESGRALQRTDFADEYFVEGSVCLDGQIYVLTWRDGKVFRYSPDGLGLLGESDYPREGWGITSDGKYLYASDGSAHIYVMDKDLRLKKKLTVRREGKLVHWLNELEFIDGKIWANVYVTDRIVVIDPSDGRVCAEVDCSGIYPRSQRRIEDDVLNGIAFDSTSGKIYLTGKNWPCLYEISIEGIRPGRRK